MRLRHKAFSILAACLFLLIAAVQAAAGQCRVLRVVDGDTVVIFYEGKKEKVRLLCVNTPESVHPDPSRNVPMGKTSSDYTKKRLLGKEVGLQFEGRKRGNYGRLLAYVFVDGENFNLELVRQGLSPYYTKYGRSLSYDEEFREAERQAMQAGLGIWGDPELEKEYRRLKVKWEGRRPDTPPPASRAAAKYVASVRSKVFHLPDCKWAARINPGNLIEFSSREEAIGSGRRPCRTCNP